MVQIEIGQGGITVIQGIVEFVDGFTKSNSETAKSYWESILNEVSSFGDFDSLQLIADFLLTASGKHAGLLRRPGLIFPWQFAKHLRFS